MVIASARPTVWTRQITLIWLAVSTLGSAPLARGADGLAQPRNHRFDGTMSREVLEDYLSRAITMEGLLNGKGEERFQWTPLPFRLHARRRVHHRGLRAD